MRGAALGLALFALLQGCGGASAQAGGDPPCVLDKCMNGTTSGGGESPATPSRGGFSATLAPGRFDFYVLSLSWSPGFCDTDGAEKGVRQCADGANLGFVVHGLWPQNAHGYPSNCDSGSRFVPRIVLDRFRGLYPDTGLAIHEWRQHGTCTGLSPADYFAQVQKARESITIPQALQSPSEPQTVAPLDIARGFIAANAGLRADALAVTCRQGELEEVRLCLAKDLRGFVGCPEVSRAACRSRSISVIPPK